MKNIKNKSIAIVGGGPGGLTLARLLEMNGANVHVYERDLNKDARVQGATLDLHDDSGLKALRAAGLMDAFKANYRPGADRLSITDRHANLLLDENVNAENEFSRPEIDRGPLRKLLLDSLHPNTVIWNSNFQSLQPCQSPKDSEQNTPVNAFKQLQSGENDLSPDVSKKEIRSGWTPAFQNGTTAYADIVIAADGANSKIRPTITNIKPFFCDLTAIEGAVRDSENNAPKIHKILKGGKIFAMGNDQSVVVSSKGDGSLNFYVSFNSDENWMRECGVDFSNNQEVLDWFRKDFAAWDPIWLELFENAETPYMVRPQYCMPFDQDWKTIPNLTMLGDAAHLMPPFAGEGVNMAMLDSLELSEVLLSDDFPDLDSAIAHYEKNMRIRASAAAKDSFNSMKMLHSPEAINFLMGIMSSIPH